MPAKTRKRTKPELNPLEAYTVAIEQLMLVAQRGTYKERLDAIEMLLQHSALPPNLEWGDGEEELA